jgi:hypothetical protein
LYFVDFQYFIFYFWGCFFYFVFILVATFLPCLGLIFDIFTVAVYLVFNYLYFILGCFLFLFFRFWRGRRFAYSASFVAIFACSACRLSLSSSAGVLLFFDIFYGSLSAVGGQFCGGRAAVPLPAAAAFYFLGLFFSFVFI